MGKDDIWNGTVGYSEEWGSGEVIGEFKVTDVDVKNGSITLQKVYKPGDKIKFKSEKQRYTVQACDDRFLICTKPFNLKKTFMYTIVDLKQNIRGCDDRYCAFTYDNPEEAKLAIMALNNQAEADEGQALSPGREYLGISYRNRIELDIEK